MPVTTVCALQVLEVMWDEDVALCLTPQAFSNIHPTADIWNNINLQVNFLYADGFSTLQVDAGQGISSRTSEACRPVVTNTGFECTALIGNDPMAALPTCLAVLKFFQYVLPGCDALGYTACTGTNFCVRAQALAKVGRTHCGQASGARCSTASCQQQCCSTTWRACPHRLAARAQHHYARLGLVS